MERSCGSSVYANMIRVAVLEADGVPLPGPSNLYTTDALTKFTATPVFYQPPALEVPNGGGGLCLSVNTRKVLKWYDTALEVCNIDPELDNMLVGGELFKIGAETVGGSVPQIGVVAAPYGVSVELWSKHMVGTDQDGVWPWIHWVIPRCYWNVDPVTWDINHMNRTFGGFANENPNWFNGPANDWTFSSDRTLAWAFSKTIPVPQCGAQALAAS